MKDSNEISVSNLKAKLLEIVREVEKGKAFRITKAGRPVALLSPTTLSNLPAVNFAKIKVTGDLDLETGEHWTFDAENLPKKK